MLHIVLGVVRRRVERKKFWANGREVGEKWTVRRGGKMKSKSWDLKCVEVERYRMVEMERGGNESDGNKRNVNGGGLEVLQASGGTTEERSENLCLEMRSGRETEMVKGGKVLQACSMLIRYAWDLRRM